MLQKKCPIVDASDQELRDFAELTLQLAGISDTITRPDLLGLIGPVWPSDFIYVDVAETPDADEDLDDDLRVEAHQSIVGGKDKDDPIWKIRVISTPLPGGDQPVSVGVGGSVKVIQRGLVADVPHRYIEALRNAVLESVRMDPKTLKISKTQFTNYPLEVLERPSRAEIDAWFERTKDEVLA